MDETLYYKVNRLWSIPSVMGVEQTRNALMNTDWIAVGIDIAKETFEVRLEVKGKAKKKQFANTPTGHTQLLNWVKHLGLPQIHACMEATGTYGEALAEYLHQSGQRVSVVNPARIKGHAKSQLKRHKTDEVDAEVIRHFCATQQPEIWQPPKPELKALRSLVRRLDDLIAMHTQETNRLQSGAMTGAVRTSVEQLLAHLDQQIADLQRHIDEHLNQYPDLRHQHDLIVSIPGLGSRTATKLLAEFMDIRGYADARSLAASVGVTPAHYKSGTSVQGATHISKVGNADLRGALWWPAISAMRYNPIIQAFVKTLRRAKKHNFAIILAVIRKLLHLVYGVIKNDTPFDAEWALKKA